MVLGLEERSGLLEFLFAAGFELYVMESWLPGTESPASLIRLWRAKRSSAALSLSCVAGPGFRASPRRTAAYPP